MRSNASSGVSPATGWLPFGPSLNILIACRQFFQGQCPSGLCISSVRTSRVYSCNQRLSRDGVHVRGTESLRWQRATGISNHVLFFDFYLFSSGPWFNDWQIDWHTRFVYQTLRPSLSGIPAANSSEAIAKSGRLIHEDAASAAVQCAAFAMEIRSKKSCECWLQTLHAYADASAVFHTAGTVALAQVYMAVSTERVQQQVRAVFQSILPDSLDDCDADTLYLTLRLHHKKVNSLYPLRPTSFLPCLIQILALSQMIYSSRPPIPFWHLLFTPNSPPCWQHPCPATQRCIQFGLSLSAAAAVLSMTVAFQKREWLYCSHFGPKVTRI